ncbi:sugar ABC transporter substrate-binding protein, partial [Mesorhizobium sp. M7A.F.Ca.US.001.04.1.1]
MKDRTDLTLSVSRRTLMMGATAGIAALAMPSVLRAQEKPTLVTSIRSLSNPYHAVWKTGAEAYAKWAGLEHVTLVSEGNSEKGIADIKAMLAKTGGNMVLNSDPNDTPDARPIVEACAKAGAYVVTQWNKPSDLHPKDFNPNYVSHIEFDGIESG